MNFMFFIYIPLVHSASHTFITTYTEINGETDAGIPEISSVSTLDGEQIYYYDSEKKKLIPKPRWIKFVSGDIWKQYETIRERVQETNKINIHYLIEQLNNLHGVHTYEQIYGCDWDEETGHSNYFDQYGYDGEDFISLDVENSTYIASVPEAFNTVAKWNNDKAQLNYLRRYYRNQCVYSIMDMLKFKKVDLERRAPEVSLLQKDPSSLVLCHATGFYPAAVTITWLGNGQDHDEDIVLGELLPNEDGTFQKTAILNVTPHNWKKHQYVCVVEHQGKTIRKILTEDEIISNSKPQKTAHRHMKYAFISIFIVFVALSIGIKVLVWRKRKGFQPVSQTDDGFYMYINKGL